VIAVTAAAASATATGTVEVATAGGFVLVANVHHKVAVGFITAVGFLDSETNIYSAPFRAFWTPGSGMGKKTGPGSGMNNPNHISESLETNFLG
jgi:hypothetical protein